MVGRIRGIQPNVGRVAISGTLYTFYSTKYQRWITRRYPSTPGTQTPARRKAQQDFKTVVFQIKRVHVEAVEFATDMTKNSGWLVRDFLMSMAFGMALEATDLTGLTWKGVRILNPEIQALLNSISNQKGSIVVRDTDEWKALIPTGTVDGQVLTIHGENTTPTWEDPPPSGVQSVTPSSGIDAAIVGTDLEIALADIANQRILANFSGTSAPPQATTLEAILELLGNTQGELIYRDATGWTVLSAGSANQVLVSNGTALGWQSVGSGGLATEPSISRWINTPAHPGFDPTCIYNASVTLSNNNKDAQPASSSPYNYLYGSPARFTGKLYLEFKPASTSFANFGFAGGGSRIIDLDSGSPGNFGERYGGQVGVNNSGQVKAIPFSGVGAAVTLATYATWAANDDLCFALDLDALLLWVRTNAGNWNNSGTANPSTGVGGLAVPMLLSGAANGLVFPGCNLGNTSKSTMRLLAADFARAVPSGFTAWGA